MITSPVICTLLLLASNFGEGLGQKRRSSPPTASQVVDFDCPEEFGYYAHPTDCTQYYVCVFGGALLESCTGGLMYSHELQTCDWPRNVGCGETSQASNAGPPQQQQTSEIRAPRPSSVSRGSQQSREQPVPKVTHKHDLYTEEELGPAEEIESDRQQRVYRGQPPTIGQVASDRDAITHSNAIPVPSSGGRDKLSVVSYGAQQQYNSFDQLTTLGNLRPDNSDHNFLTNMRSRMKRHTLLSHHGGRELGISHNGRLPSWVSPHSHLPQSYMYHSHSGRHVHSLLPHHSSHDHRPYHGQTLQHSRDPDNFSPYGHHSRTKPKGEFNAAGFTFGPLDAKMNTNNLPANYDINQFAQITSPHMPTPSAWLPSNKHTEGYSKPSIPKPISNPAPFSLRDFYTVRQNGSNNNTHIELSNFNTQFLTPITTPKLLPTTRATEIYFFPSTATESDVRGMYTHNQKDSRRPHGRENESYSVTEEEESSEEHEERHKSKTEDGSNEGEQASSEEGSSREKSNENVSTIKIDSNEFQKPSFPKPPPEYFKEPVLSFEDSNNPFADPNFDFDKFLSDLRGGNVGQSVTHRNPVTVDVSNQNPTYYTNRLPKRIVLKPVNPKSVVATMDVRTKNNKNHNRPAYTKQKNSTPVPKHKDYEEYDYEDYEENDYADDLISRNKTYPINLPKPPIAPRPFENLNTKTRGKEDDYRDDEEDDDESEEYDEYEDSEEEQEDEDNRSQKNAQSNGQNIERPLQKYKTQGTTRGKYYYRVTPANTTPRYSSQNKNNQHSKPSTQNDKKEYTNSNWIPITRTQTHASSPTKNMNYHFRPDSNESPKNKMPSSNIATTTKPNTSQSLRPMLKKDRFPYTKVTKTKDDNLTPSTTEYISFYTMPMNPKDNDKRLKLSQLPSQLPTSASPSLVSNHKKTQRQRPNGQFKASDSEMSDYYSKAYTQRTLTQLRASVAPQQTYIESVTSAPARTYNSSRQQYIAQQYDPYYSLYDEEADLYKDIDYSQYTTNQGNQGQRYRPQPSYKERKPTVEIIQQDPVQRGSGYSKNKYNTQQDLYQPSVTQQEYESYNIQTNDDDIQYRQPVQTKSSNRLAPIRGTEGTLGSKEEKVSALPEGVERNNTLGTHRVTLTARFPHQDPLPTQSSLSKESIPVRFPTETTDRSRQTTQQTESTSINYISQRADSITNSFSQKQYSPESSPRAEKLVQSRKPFVIQVTTQQPEDESLQKKSYEIIKSFLEEQRKTGQAPRPFRPRAESRENYDEEPRRSSNRESQQSRGHFIASTPSTQNLDYTLKQSGYSSSNTIQSKTTTTTTQRPYISRGRQEENDYLNSRNPIVNRVPYNNDNSRQTGIRTSASRQNEKGDSQQVTQRAKSVIVEEYSITSKPVSSRLDTDYILKQKQTANFNRGQSSPSEAHSPRKTTPVRVTPDFDSLVKDFTITTHRPISNRFNTTTEQIYTRRPTTTTAPTTTTVRQQKLSEIVRSLSVNPYSVNSELSESEKIGRRRPIGRGSAQRDSEQFKTDINEENNSQINEPKSARYIGYTNNKASEDVRNDYQFSAPKTAPQKIYTKPTTTTQTSAYRVNKDSAIERQTNSVPYFETDSENAKPIRTTEPNLRGIDSIRYNDIDKKSFDSAPSNIQCTSNCTDKQTLRVRPTSYDTQATPGITRGTTRNRGSLTYTVSPNEAEPSPVHRGTPAVSRVRPTLKPSTAIVSKAAEFIDIYRFPPTRPDPVYPTPQVDKTAAKCRKDVCLLPDCYCGGKDIPGELPLEETPQIVLLTFDDSVNDLNKGLYSDLFDKGRTNPNGCPISATFYVSHEWTDYSQVQNLYAGGHEIASHSVSHSFGEQFSQKKWTREIAGQREILAAYGGVKQEDIRGMRAPFLAVGGNKMFKMLYDANFTYDSSMPVYENKPPSWPYTMDYKIFHDCMIPPCPTRSYPGVWEVPMVMWQDLNGGRCSMGDACSNPPTSDGVYKMLLKNFERHFTSNRAPFGLFYHAAWFTQPHHKEGFISFLDTIVNMPEVWLVSNWQAIQWVRDPTPISRLSSFAPFQCNYPDRPKKCNNPKVCNLWHKSGVRYMRTCQACPEVYPWTGKTGVRNSRVDNEIFPE